MDFVFLTENLQSHKTIVDNNKLYINTWIGNYLYEGRNCNWISLHEMYQELYSSLEEILGKRLDILDREYYQPFIDFSFYEIPQDFECSYDNTIIFSNGPVLSGQSSIDSTSNIIKSLCESFPNKKIILTHPSDISHKNIIYTSDITKIMGSDINEVSWISTKCRYIIGRQSGPFSFMQIKDNVNCKDKTMISFSNSKEVDWLYKINTECNYYNILDHNEESLINSISSIIFNESLC